MPEDGTFQGRAADWIGPSRRTVENLQVLINKTERQQVMLCVVFSINQAAESRNTEKIRGLINMCYGNPETTTGFAAPLG